MTMGVTTKPTTEGLPSSTFFKYARFSQKPSILLGLVILLSAFLLIPSPSVQNFVRRFKSQPKLNSRSVTISEKKSSFSNIQLTSREIGKIGIWEPEESCRGLFTSVLPEEEGYNTSIPYAMVRDAHLDRTANVRFPSEQYIQASIYVSVHMSSTMHWSSATTSIGIITRIEQIDTFLNINNLEDYEHGDVNKRGYSVREWRVSISLPRDSLFHDTFLTISLPLKRFDGHIIQFKPWMHVSCILGLKTLASKPNKEVGSTAPCLSSRRTVLFGGKGVFGDEPKLLAQQLAHFTARAIFGEFRFTSVVMALNVPYSQSELGKKDVTSSRSAFENIKYMRDISHMVEQELIELQVWHKFPGNGLTIIPTCTLGTATQLNENCSLSSMHGQYAAGLMLHSLFSQDFKWAFSMDMDEFLYTNGNNNEDGVTKKNMVDELDRIDKREGFRGYFTLKWFNFKFPKQHLITNLTNDILTRSPISLTARRDLKEKVNEFVKLNSTICLTLKRDKHHKMADTTGKTALRCDVGDGFKVHLPAIRSKQEATKFNESEEILTYPKELMEDLPIRVWHARFESVGVCMYGDRGNPKAY